MHFPARPHRNEGEGAIGYLMRLGETHGVSGFSEMLLEAGVRRHGLSRGIGVNRVADVLGFDRAALGFDSGRATSKSVFLRGEKMRRRQWSVHFGRRACPACFASDLDGSVIPRPWHRAWWDVRAVTVCPLHGIPLIGSCGHCGAPLDFESNLIGRCRSGHPLWEVVPRPVQHFAGDEYIVGRLGGCPRMQNPVLDAGKLGEAIEAMDLVGRCRLGGRAGAADVTLHVVLDAGLTVFSTWPTAFDRILDALLRASDLGLGRWGAAAAYRPLHERLLEMGRGKIATALKDRLRMHAAAHGVTMSKPAFGARLAPTSVCSVSEASRRLHVSFERARRIMQLEGAIPDETRRGTPIRIPKALVERIAVELGEPVGLDQVAARLKIGRSQTRRLVAAGLLGDRRPSPSLPDADRLIARLCADAPAVTHTDLCPLPDACRRARCGIDKAVRAILSGDAKVIARGSENGLRGALVSVCELRAIGKTSRNKMTVADAADKLGTKWETARALNRLGVLGTTSSGIDHIAVQTFRNTFISASAIAKCAGIRPQSVIRLLAGLDLKPAISKPDCRQVFFKRRSIFCNPALRLKFPAIYAAALD